MRAWARWWSLPAIALALGALPGPATASPPRPAGLWVAGGADSWHADNGFSLSWTTPPPGSPTLVATRYRILDPQETTIEESRLAWIGDGIGPLVVPRVPGVYGVEVWFEDATGEQGPAAAAQLRFDDVRPAAIAPEPISGWVGRTALPLRVRLGHPAGPLPLSGIRGYAVAVAASPDRAPCSAADRCTDAETTLRAGVGGDTVGIAALPEGVSYLQAVAVSGSGMKSAASGTAKLRVDLTNPVTRLSGVPSGWTNRTAWLSASAIDTGSGMAPEGEGRPPFTAIGVDGAPPTIGLGGFAATSVIAEGAHRVVYYARDTAGNVDDGAAGNGIPNRAPQAAWVRIDRTPPRVAFVNSQDPRDPDLLRVRIVDPLSGPNPSRGRIGIRRAGSGDRFELLPPAPARNDEQRARWDSDAHPPGDYEFRAVAYDAAGNSATTMRRVDGAPMLLSNPLKATTSLRAGFHRRGPRRTVPYGRRVLLDGRLTTGRNTPLGGMPVRIVERFAAGSQPPARVSTVRTGADGAFSIRTAPGPSRTIAIGFGGSPTLARSEASSLDLRVRSRVRLRASSALARVGGPPVVFKGRIVAAPAAIPSEGRSVQLQFRLPGLPWAEFRTIQTDRHGRFRYAYRFSDDDSRGARFQFRAYAPAQEGWPHEPAGSRPISVKGI